VKDGSGHIHAEAGSFRELLATNYKPLSGENGMCLQVGRMGPVK
jgi:hypothetical protein